MAVNVSEKRAARVKRAEPQPARTESPARKPFLLWLWLLLGGFVVALFVFGPALRGGFVFDDYHLPFADAAAQDASPMFWLGGVRPLASASYWINFLISGTQPLRYHLLSVLLHAIAATLVFFVLNRILALAGLKDADWRWPLFGAAVFLVHPLQTESVDYIAGRPEVVCAIFFFAAWLVFLRHFESEISFEAAVKVLLLFVAAVLGKESAVALPAILIATDLYWGRGTLRSMAERRYKLYIPLLAILAFGAKLIIQKLAESTSVGAAAAGATPFQYALTQCKVILIYLGLFFVPLRQSADWNLPFFHSLADGAAWFYVLVFLALIGAAVWLYPRLRLVSFGIVVFLLALAPTSSLVPIRDALAERRMYVPIIGLIVAVIGVVIRLRIRPAVVTAAMAISVCLLSLRSFDRSRAWSSDLALWRDTVSRDPVNARARLGLGSALVKAGNCGAAIPEFKTVETDPEWAPVAKFNLAAAYQCNNQLPQALATYRAYAETEPTSVAYTRIGFLEGRLGHAEQAMAALDKALELEPGNAEASRYRQILVNELRTLSAQRPVAK
jgi:tetratricopeptide (TPR) repeat protein